MKIFLTILSILSLLSSHLAEVARAKLMILTLLKVILQKAELLYFKDLKKDRPRTVFFFAQSARTLPMR